MLYDKKKEASGMITYGHTPGQLFGSRKGGVGIGGQI